MDMDQQTSAALVKDLVTRTHGDMYVGVVGAVRTGKSTFIKRFMETVVLPHIEDPAERMRAQDELPQSAAGKTIMTTEPKFVPNQAVTIRVTEGIDVSVRLVDCVGYTVPGALGYADECGPRMVHTPWFAEPIPFEEAAEIGTRKVIQEHCTLGVLVTTDGSIADIARADYVEAERRVIQELRDVGKPFVMIINSIHPQHPDTLALRASLTAEYDIPVVVYSVQTMTKDDMMDCLREVLVEFPVCEIHVHLPNWVLVLEPSHWLRSGMETAVRDCVRGIRRVRDIERLGERMCAYEHIERAVLASMHMGHGVAVLEVHAPRQLYDQILVDIVGTSIDNKASLLALMMEYRQAKIHYDRFKEAIDMVQKTGYGVATPALSEMVLDEPELIRQGSRFGVRLKATAPSIHLIRVDVESEFAPIIGTEKQSEELVRYLMQDFEVNPLRIWESDMFGRSLHSIVREGIQAKLALFPDHARYKLQETLGRIINEGSGGMIAILL
jgi:stage IV sporulation protein A